MEEALKALEVIKKVLSSPFIGFFFFSATIILSVILFFFSRKHKEPRYWIRGFNLVNDFSSKYEGLEALFRGRKVRNLTVTKIAFWNAGRETIEGGDISEVDHLRVESKEGVKILDAKVIINSKKANRLSIVLQENSGVAKLQFDYLDKKDGGIFQIIHDGKSEKDVELKGAIKGVSKLLKKSTIDFITKLSIAVILIPGFLIICIILSALIAEEVDLDKLLGGIFISILLFTFGLLTFALKLRDPLRRFEFFEAFKERSLPPG